ncbi:hypothetical protein LTR78_006766 [Recurvomyces mirabilis]|uniref:Uncharacterized protein n=2 Tax=Recurvomyces mirabilis TaxID=574656 RepID=A0AAE1BZ66_9PEZI|nr:hypothetical protein LTR78_006766 [Recurvomyces mirabilis]
MNSTTFVTTTIVSTAVSASASPTFSFNTATTTSIYTVNSTVYTCATAGAASITSSSSSSSVVPIVTKRQDASTTVSLPTACVGQLINFATWQLKWGICRGCLGISATSSVSTVYTSTVTTTIDATVTSVIPPTITATSIQTSLFNTMSTTTITSVEPTVILGTSTIVTTTTVTTTLSSPQPTRFSISYTNTSSDGTVVKYFGRAANLTNGDTTVVQFSPSDAALDQWSLDSQGRLENLSDDEYVAKNTFDYLPWLYLLNTSAPQNTPSCIGCNNTLFCNYPNTTGNSFSSCGGFLALGPAATLNSSSLCVPITLRYGLI